jgi:choline kinase
MAVILAGGEGERLSILSQERAKPAVPFGGEVPDHRLHALELRQLRDRQRRRPDPVQPTLAQ